jgi:hypothetical protein
VEAASIEELHQKIQTLEREKNKEEEYRNYMQLERVGAWQGFCCQLQGSAQLHQHSQCSVQCL